jgi:hypothetical protein
LVWPHNWGIGNVQRLQQQGATPEQIIAASRLKRRRHSAGDGWRPASKVTDPFAGLPGYVAPKAKDAERYQTLTALEEVRALGLPVEPWRSADRPGRYRLSIARDLPGGGQVIENLTDHDSSLPARRPEGSAMAGFYQRMVSANQQMQKLVDKG